MIVTTKLVWYHLPKTAGTTTDHLFKASGIPLFWQDSQSSYLKHLPPIEHPSLDLIPIRGKQPVVNFRRLPLWLVSNYQHKLQRMGLQLSPDSLKEGLFWRDREQQWLPADWWIQRFGIDTSWSFLRVESLKPDFLSCLATYEPISLPKKFKVRIVSSRNKNYYNRDLSKWFDTRDLSRIYDANPLWTKLEKQVYGSLLNIQEP